MRQTSCLPLPTPREPDLAVLAETGFNGPLPVLSEVALP